MQKPTQDIQDYLDLFDTDFPLEYYEIVNVRLKLSILLYFLTE